MLDILETAVSLLIVAMLAGSIAALGAALRRNHIRRRRP